MPALAITLIATPALAGLELVEQDTKTVGATTITWDASFEDLNYRVDETIEMSVHWTVDEGLVRSARSTCRGPARRVGRGFFCYSEEHGDWVAEHEEFDIRGHTISNQQSREGAVSEAVKEPESASDASLTIPCRSSLFRRSVSGRSEASCGPAERNAVLPREADMTRVRALRVSALSFSVLVFANTAAAQPEEIPISGCNSQMLASGAEVFWTSSFATDDYGFEGDEDSRSGAIVSGEGDTLEVTVQWSASGPQTESGAIAFGPRGAGFSPGGVGGEVIDFGIEPELPLADPGQCEVDPDALSYGHFTFTLKFTSLHKPARRGGGVAKGNAQVEVDVSFGDEVVSLGTNVHVATGPDPDA